MKLVINRLYHNIFWYHIRNSKEERQNLVKAKNKIKSAKFTCLLKVGFFLWEIMKGVLNKWWSSNYLTPVFASKGCSARKVSTQLSSYFPQKHGQRKRKRMCGSHPWEHHFDFRLKTAAECNNLEGFALEMLWHALALCTGVSFFFFPVSKVQPAYTVNLSTLDWMNL